MLFYIFILSFCNITILFFVMLFHFVTMYWCFVLYNAIFFLVASFCKDKKSFCKLQYYFVSWYVILLCHFVVISLSCVLLCCFVMLYWYYVIMQHCFIDNNLVFCLILFFCKGILLFCTLLCWFVIS